MMIRIEVLLKNKVLESYEAPDGSWIQCDTIGAQHLPALSEATEYTQLIRATPYTVRFTPINPPHIPKILMQLLNSYDKRWGRNGYEWMGSHRQNSGGTTLDRARELHAKGWPHKLDVFPLSKDRATQKFLEQNYIKVWKDHAPTE